MTARMINSPSKSVITIRRGGALPHGPVTLPIEVAFGNRYRSEFDKFCRDFLALKLKPSKQFRADAIYHHFRDYFLTVTAHRSVEDVLSELRRYANYYVRFSLGRETDAAFAGRVKL